MAFDATKVPAQYADLFYHGVAGADGNPVGLTDEEYDGQKALLREFGDWPLDPDPNLLEPLPSVVEPESLTGVLE